MTLHTLDNLNKCSKFWSLFLVFNDQSLRSASFGTMLFQSKRRDVPSLNMPCTLSEIGTLTVALAYCLREDLHHPLQVLLLLHGLYYFCNSSCLPEEIPCYRKVCPMVLPAYDGTQQGPQQGNVPKSQPQTSTGLWYQPRLSLSHETAPPLPS